MEQTEQADFSKLSLAQAAQRHADVSGVLTQASTRGKTLPELAAQLLMEPAPLGFKGHSELIIFEHAYGDEESGREAYEAKGKAYDVAALAFCRARMKRIEGKNALHAQNRILFEDFVGISSPS